GLSRPRHDVEDLLIALLREFLIDRPRELLELLDLVIAGGEVGYRFDTEEGLLADLLVQQDVADRHQPVLYRAQHLRALEAKRAAGVQRDDEFAIRRLLDRIGESLGILDVEIAGWPGERQ